MLGRGEQDILLSCLTSVHTVTEFPRLLWGENTTDYNVSNWYHTSTKY